MSTRHLDGAPWDRRVVIIPADEGVVFTLTEQHPAMLSHDDDVDVEGDNMQHAEVTGIGLQAQIDRLRRVRDYNEAMADGMWLMADYALAEKQRAPRRGVWRRLAAGWAAFVASLTDGRMGP